MKIKDILAKIVGMKSGDAEYINDATYVFRNDDGTWSVCDNGEEVVVKNAHRAAQIAKENLS